MAQFKQLFGDAKVFYRIFPCEILDWNNVRVLDDKKHIQIHHVGPRIEEKPGSRIFKQFETDGIFYNIPQVEIFDKVMEGVIENVFQGQNGIIVAFGQTGSGKSLTVGGLNTYQDRGLIPRSIEKIFRMRAELPEHLDMEIEISYIEILSMGQAHDLLKPYPALLNKYNIHRKAKKIKIRNDLDALRYVFLGEGRKEYTPDNNYPSHSGSCIFSFIFTLRNTKFSEAYQVESKLHIIDMAGNDIFGDKSSHLKQSQQVGAANSTKSYMEHFMLLLGGSDAELVRVKERANIISQYLGNTFRRDSLLRFIGHLKTEEDDLFLAISMLKFGQKIKNLEPHGTTVVLKSNDLMKTAILQAKVDALRREKVLSEMLRNKEPKEMCQERKKQIQDFVEDYVKNLIDELHLFELGDISTIVKVMKDKIAACEEEKSMLNKNLLEALETKAEKSDVSLNVQKSVSNKLSKTILAAKSQSTHSDQSGKESRSIHMRKSTSLIKAHRKDSIAEADTKSISKKNKVSSGSVNGTKRSLSSSKKKLGMADSTGSVDKTTKKIHVEQSGGNLLIPDVIPEHKDALREYLSSDKTIYKDTLETFKKHDAEAKAVYENYLKELKSLNNLFEVLELRKNEIIQSKMLRQFSKKEQFDFEGNANRSFLEIKCAENLKQAENNVLKQQEIILNLQAELRMLIGIRQRLKTLVKEDFDKFCKEKYNLPVRNLEDINETIFENEEPIEEICRADICDIIETCTKDAVYNEIYENLKKLMIVEARKKAQYLKKSIKWVDNMQISTK